MDSVQQSRALADEISEAIRRKMEGRSYNEHTATMLSIAIAMAVETVCLEYQQPSFPGSVTLALIMRFGSPLETEGES